MSRPLVVLPITMMMEHKNGWTRAVVKSINGEPMNATIAMVLSGPLAEPDVMQRFRDLVAAIMATISKDATGAESVRAFTANGDDPTEH